MASELSFVFLFAILFFLSPAQSHRYDGYKVLRVNTTLDAHYDELHTLTEKFNLDVWAGNKIEGWVDVMVSPVQFEVLSVLGFDYQVTIPNVQEHIDQNEQERRERREKGNYNAFFDDFQTTGAILQWLNEQVTLHSNKAKQVIMGQTYLGQDIIGLEITTDASKPVFFLHCTIHAREWIATTSCLWIIDKLLNDASNTDLLAKFRWVIIPVFNVDGYDYTHTSQRLWRKNRAPNSGSTCVGTDVNRNYGYGWGGAGASSSPCAETYRGTFAWSSPEATSERNYLKPYVDSSTLAAYIDIHSYGGYFMSAWGYTTTLPADYPAMREQMTASVTAIRAVNGRTYTAGASSVVLYQTSGSTVDYLYGDAGVIQAYTIECYGNSFVAAPSDIPVIGSEVWAGVKAVATAI